MPAANCGMASPLNKLRNRDRKHREPGYSSYATAARALWSQQHGGPAPPANYIGPARTHHAARAGRQRIAGYSAKRQGGPPDPFRGLREHDRMQKEKQQGIGPGGGPHTPGLDAYHAAQNDPDRVRPKSSSRLGPMPERNPGERQQPARPVQGVPMPPAVRAGEPRHVMTQRWQDGSPLDATSVAAAPKSNEHGPVAGFFDPSDRRSRENWEKNRRS